MNSVNSSTSASFVAWHRKPFTGGDYIKESFRYHNINSRTSKTIVKLFRVKDMPLFANSVKDRTIKMAANITDIHSATQLPVMSQKMSVILS